MRALSAAPRLPTSAVMRHEERDDYQAWLWGEVLLIGLLGAALALFVAYPGLRNSYALPQARLVLDTAVMLAGGDRGAARRASASRSTDGGSTCCSAAGSAPRRPRRSSSRSLPCSAGSRSTACRGLGRDRRPPVRMGADRGGAVRPTGRSSARGRALGEMLLGGRDRARRSPGASRTQGAVPRCRCSTPSDSHDQPLLLTGALAAAARLLSLTAMVGFGLRFRARGNDLDRWLCLGATLALFAELHYVFTPLLSSGYVSQGDFLRLLSYGVLLVGVWRAIRYAEFGRAVAEERARVAREIHDGLAQYLFAVSTHASMLENGADPERTLRAAQGGGRRRAAGGALRRTGAVVGRRLGAVRRRPAPLRRLPHRRRPARGRPRDPGRDPARARRADRGLPDRPGGARQRAQARPRAPRGSADRGARRRAARDGRRRRLRLRRGRDRTRPGPEEHAGAGRLDRWWLSARLHARTRNRAPGRAAGVGQILFTSLSTATESRFEYDFQFLL